MTLAHPPRPARLRVARVERGQAARHRGQRRLGRRAAAADLRAAATRPG
ncbi:MAG TPA: hypothetical protein VNN74_04365 [Candidatus Micrarchaeia archaeon]|nr:hypothetical protein [Candidatus Micrarchaeia archaeon]